MHRGENLLIPPPDSDFDCPDNERRYDPAGGLPDRRLVKAHAQTSVGLIAVWSASRTLLAVTCPNTLDGFRPVPFQKKNFQCIPSSRIDHSFGIKSSLTRWRPCFWSDVARKQCQFR